MGHAMYIMTTLLLIVYTVVGQFKFLYTLNEDVDKHVHRHQVENATDYAMFSMLANSEDLQADYANFGSIDVDPRVAYDVFIREYMYSMYNSNSDEAYTRTIERFIMGICLTFDGYYLMDKESNITVKIPYIYESENIDDDVGSLRYNINLSDSTLKEINPATGSRRQRAIQSSEVDGVIKQLESNISKEINLKIQNYYKNDIEYQAYVPFFKNALSGVQGINSISLIFLMDNGYTYKDMPEITVSASRVVVNRFVLGYEKNGEKLYTWASNRNILERDGVEIKKMFKNKKTAAELGYNFDVALQYK